MNYNKDICHKAKIFAQIYAQSVGAETHQLFLLFIYKYLKIRSTVV